MPSRPRMHRTSTTTCHRPAGFIAAVAGVLAATSAGAGPLPQVPVFPNAVLTPAAYSVPSSPTPLVIKPVGTVPTLQARPHVPGIGEISAGRAVPDPVVESLAGADLPSPQWHTVKVAEDRTAPADPPGLLVFEDANPRAQVRFAFSSVTLTLRF